MVDPVRARSFGPVAAAYDAHRPGYPDEAVDLALDGTGPRVLDLGAGTGKLTRSLLDRGRDVVAVEPDAGMLAVLTDRLPGVDTRRGSAEQIPLPDGAVDAVLVGQALHWFDIDRATPEIARVLRPGGLLAGLWNGVDGDVDWIAAMEELRTGAPRPADNPAGGGEGPEMPGPPWFSDAQERRVAWSWETTVEGYVHNLRTHSWALTSDPAHREAVLDGMRDLLAAHADTTGTLVLPMRTIVWRTHRV
ncbi:class I SAM-dependent methyltransferase [Pseudonocardia nematodicida]|uniref:Class I SAM-dependent methyltransferase n=1 Tax=Pseudonocardia nematodicida TaxID=1206997 RepID=A0ABV1KF62_9PSEU